MKAAMRRWEMDAPGRDRLEPRQVPMPQPGHGEVLVKVGVVSLKQCDKLVVEDGRGLPLALPFNAGSDLAGTVVALGQDTTRFQVGERVISTCGA